MLENYTIGILLFGAAASNLIARACKRSLLLCPLLVSVTLRRSYILFLDRKNAYLCIVLYGVIVNAM